MKISRRTREQAALICAIAASGPYTIGYVAWHVGARFDHEVLAGQALTAALDLYPVHDSGDRPPDFSRVVRAEAEALLRTGWSP